MSARRMHRLRWAWLACVLVLVTGGCVGLPVAGPVVESPADEGDASVPGVYFDPRPPQPGQTPSEIVGGFLEAMKASPITTRIARGFLTQQAQRTWQPERGIRTYADVEDPIGGANVQVTLREVNTFDTRGAWASRAEAETVRFSLVREGGEWRIDSAPDALMVPQSWFEDWYRRVSLYRFDPSAQILVPEIAHVPSGEAFASSLVRGLLPLPGDDQAVSRTHFPEGLDLLSVPIDSAGVADVPLTGMDGVDELTGQRMLVQVIWTLRQEARIRAVRLKVADQVIGASGGATQVNLDVGSAHDPNGVDATADTFALRGGRLVRGAMGEWSATSGPLGSRDLGVGPFSVNISGTRVAALSGERSALLLAPVDGSNGSAEQVLSGARRLLTPRWDHRDRLWIVDRAAGRARVMLVVDGQARTIRVPGVSGRAVTDFVVSRDGTRLVAALEAPGAEGDRVVAARIVSDPDGRVLSAEPAIDLALGGNGAVSVGDVAWRTPTTLWVLTRSTAQLSEVRAVSVDGAPTPVTESGSVRLRGTVRGILSSPVEGTSTYALMDGTVTDLGPGDRVPVQLPEGVDDLTYVG